MKYEHHIAGLLAICLGLILGCSAQSIHAQTPAETLAFARQQMAEGNEILAAKTYQRLVFFTGDRYREECYGQLAGLFFRQGDMEKSAHFFDLLYHAAHSDSLRYEAVFGKAGALLLLHEHKKCLIELFALPADLPENWARRRWLYLGAAQFGARDFDAAEAALQHLFAPEDVVSRRQLRDLLDKARRVERKSPKTARVLSMVLPGAGQFYAGDIKNGFNSLLLNALLGYWFVSTAQGYTFFDASFTVMPWFLRYHAGGYKHVGQILEHEKEDRQRRIFQKILVLQKTDDKH